VSTSDVPFVTCRHTRVGIRYPPDVLSGITLLADGDAELNLQAKGLLLHPAGEGKAGIGPRTPSIVSRTCKRLTRRPCTRRLFKEPAHTRTVSPSAHSCPASGGATNFFLASALSGSPTGLATSRWRRRAMRPTDFCHPNELRVPAPCAFPARSRDFRRGDAPRRLRLRAVLLGDRTFHDVRRPLRRIVIEHESRALLPHGLETRAWAFSSHGVDATEPLTPLSRFPFQPPPHPPSRVLQSLAVRPSFERFGTGRRLRKPPRPPLTPSRER
jgi:hypothetical protein